MIQQKIIRKYKVPSNFMQIACDINATLFTRNITLLGDTLFLPKYLCLIKRMRVAIFSFYKLKI